MHHTRQVAGAEKTQPAYGQMAAVAARDTRFRGGHAHFCTLLAILSHANWKADHRSQGLGEVLAHMQTMAEEFGIAISTFRRCATQLEQWGYIRTEPRRTRWGGRPRKHFFAVDPKLISVPIEFDASCRQGRELSSRAASPSKATAASVATSRATNGTTLNHEPTEENRPAEHTSPKQTKGNSSSLPTNTTAAEFASRIMITTDMPFPKTLTKMANGCGLDRESTKHEWALFVASMNGALLTSDELRARLKAWMLRPASTSRYAAGEKNAARQQDADDPQPELRVIGNMEMPNWAQGLACGLEEDDCLFEWRKWTLDNHGKSVPLVTAKVSWSRFATNARQYLVRKGVYYTQEELRELNAEAGLPR